MPPATFDDWVGLPYLELGRDRHGIDCFGIFIRLNLERRGVVIPDMRLTALGVRRQAVEDPSKYDYEPVVDECVEGDALLFSCRGRPLHVGYCIDQRRMLHIEDNGLGSMIEKHDVAGWASRKLGVYRYVGR